MLKTNHESQNGLYANIEAVVAESTDVFHVFTFSLLDSTRSEACRTSGRIEHDALSHSIKFTYSNGAPVEGADAVALSDALLAWLNKNGYLEG